jgi:hypothetical protein
MRKVEVKVSTISLGQIEVIKTYNDEETLQILREADGYYDDDVVDAIEESTGDFLSTYDFYFAHPGYHNWITVVDNGEETVYENALSDRYIDDSFLYEYINSDIDFENPTDEMEEEYYYNTGIEISDCLRIVNAEVVEKDGPMPYELFERIKNKDEKIKEDRSLTISHFRACLEGPWSNTNKEVCLIRCTDRGKDFICFDIYLEDDEEFDINKLHIFGECDWWDEPRDHYESLLGIADILPLHSAILDFVEYNGKIYCHDGQGARGWGYVDRSEQWALINTDMSDVELD